MDDIARQREAVGKAVFERLSKSTRNPYLNAGQLQFGELHADISRLPSATGPEVIVMDPTSPNYGQLVFLPGYSALDGPDIIL